MKLALFIRLLLICDAVLFLVFGLSYALLLEPLRRARRARAASVLPVSRRKHGLLLWVQIESLLTVRFCARGSVEKTSRHRYRSSLG